MTTLFFILELYEAGFLPAQDFHWHMLSSRIILFKKQELVGSMIRSPSMIVWRYVPRLFGSNFSFLLVDDHGRSAH